MPQSFEDSDSAGGSQDYDLNIPVISLGDEHPNFRRKFLNPDYSTCWLNSCLQLLLTALDHVDSSASFKSELGEELIRLRDSDQESSLDPTVVKNIIVTAEDTRIAVRLSELEAEIKDKEELRHQTEIVQTLRYNLLHGQQCIRDFFLCMQENAVSWLDVTSLFYFTIKYSTVCCGCNHVIQSETDQMYIEIDVPPHNANLSEYLENYFCTSTLSARHCHERCQTLSEAEKRCEIKIVGETEFFIIILTRTIETLDGFELNQNKIISTDDVYIR